jgi:transposase
MKNMQLLIANVKKIGRYIIMDNASILKTIDIKSAIEKRGYKVADLPPYSPYLNAIELIWSKVKAGVKRSCLTATDNLFFRIEESPKLVTPHDCQGLIKHSLRFFDRYSALEPML